MPVQARSLLSACGVFPKVDPVLGLSDDYALAYYKSLEAAGSFLPNEGAVLINLSEQAIEIGKEL